MQQISRKLHGRLHEYSRVAPDKMVPIHPLDQAARAYHGHISRAMDAGIPLNPTHFCWDILIADLGFPFIKRDLLQFNRVKIPTIADWRRVIGKASSYDTDLIRRHLIQRLRGRVV